MTLRKGTYVTTAGGQMVGKIVDRYDEESPRYDTPRRTGKGRQLHDVLWPHGAVGFGYWEEHLTVLGPPKDKALRAVLSIEPDLSLRHQFHPPHDQEEEEK